MLRLLTVLVLTATLADCVHHAGAAPRPAPSDADVYVLPGNANDSDRFCVQKSLSMPGSDPPAVCMTVGDLRQLVRTLRVAEDDGHATR